MVRIPSYRRHKKTGLARVTLGGKDFYLGKYGTRESRDAYQRLTGEYIASLGRPPVGDQITLVELTSGFKRYAKTYYVGHDGKPTGWYAFIAEIMQQLGTSSYSEQPAAHFGPLALKAVREGLIAEGLGRSTINKKIDIIKRAFKWAAGEELIPGEAYNALRVVEGLRMGKSKAVESAPILPVDDRDVELTLPHLPEIIRDMVRLQRLTGMRPAEVCIMRPQDLAIDGEDWVYRPSHHKTQHHGRERTIFIGPRAQAVLRPYLARDPSLNCFVPIESEARRRAEKHLLRLTPIKHGNRPGTNRKRNPRWVPGQGYTTDAYRRAICRACELAFGMPDDLGAADRQAWRAKHCWSPNQLRHTAATEIRKRFGLEAVQVTLGHSSANVTQIYAERDQSKAAEVARLIG